MQPLGVHDVSINADAIPVVKTPPDGYGDTFPDPVLATCTESIVDGAPDMCGLWQVVEVLVDGAAVPEHRILDSVQRIEQCGDRVTITAGGTRAANRRRSHRGEAPARLRRPHVAVPEIHVPCHPHRLTEGTS